MRHHKECGGKIVSRQCLKCGHQWGKVAWLRGTDTYEPPRPAAGGFDAKEYRERIRKGKDIFK